VIRAVGLTKRFGRHTVLDGLDLEVTQGERVALLGLNGAGKTTFIRCLLGLLPFEGSLTVADRDVRGSGRDARSRLGYVPQRAPHFDGTLHEVIDFFTRLRGTDPAAVEARLAALGLALAEHGDKPVRTLSGGMLQKALLALALGAEVPLLLLDEPTANLDARARREFLRSLTQVNDGTTILLASHRFADVEAVADRLLVLHGGRIAFDGRMQELRERVEDAVTLWIEVPQELREQARRRIETAIDLSTVSANGAALGVQVRHAARVDVLLELKQGGIPVEDFWTEAPSLHDLLEGTLGLETGASGSAPPEPTP
jgi:ABC-2 type transport system ATP-binding protein/nitrous oxidase accessory protein